MTSQNNQANGVQEFYSGGIIDQPFTEKIVELYRDLLASQNSPVNNNPVLSQIIIHITESPVSEQEQDFDLVFLGYLALLKSDFPAIPIHIYYRSSQNKVKSKRALYQLGHHQNHFFITTGKELFELYQDGKLHRFSQIKPSESYLPLLFVDRQSISLLFGEPVKKDLFRKRFKKLSAKLDHTAHADSFTKMKAIYQETLGERKNWKAQDLCGLYLLDTLTRLPVAIDDLFGTPDTIYKSIDLEAHIKKITGRVILEKGVLELTQMEIYCLSLLIRKGQFNSVPKNDKQVFKKHPELSGDNDDSPVKDGPTNIIEFYLAYYEDNLTRVIQEAKDIAYGLMELAKNSVEHTASGKGVITGRIYKFDRIRRLKRVNPGWVSKFSVEDEFIDLNVMDSGLKGICSSYRENLSMESYQYSSHVLDQEERELIEEEYRRDLEELKGYHLNNFFDFNSIKLFHQINRIKARLGLLIFSQTILSERSAFVKVASNDFEDNYPLGYALFEKNGLIHQEDMGDFYRLGTNYNFIIPVSTIYINRLRESPVSYQESSMPSSVFLELQQYDLADGPTLVKPILQEDFREAGKYLKLDLLKAALGTPGEKQLFELDATALLPVLNNSSDWVRFLANMQFSVKPVRELIVKGMPPDLYVEIIKILTIFDRIRNIQVGFWKEQRFVLFFMPVQQPTGRKDPYTQEPETDTFWFNSLLCGASYQQFVNTNLDIDQYHNNLSKIISGLRRDPETKPVLPEGLLFSTSHKLLNFELLLKGTDGLSLFEETTRSLVNIEIKDAISWK